MTIKERIISYLQNHPEGIDDDELAYDLQLHFRQDANSRCRQLARQKLVIRQVVDGKIHNFWVGNGDQVMLPSISRLQKTQYRPAKHLEWFWEGNVQTRIIAALAEQGYVICSSTDTEAHERGIDIVAEKSGKQLWVSVKGYPCGTVNTKPATQAGHWFTHVIFNVLEYRQRDKDVALGVGLPDFLPYRSMAKKIGWVKTAANFSYFWVDEAGEVTVE